jgi:hypothetical protein
LEDAYLTTAADSSFVTKDSGERTDFGTGSVRDVETGKLDLTLLFGFRHAWRRFVGLLQRGADKYGRHNWQKGQSLSRAERSLLRHVDAYLAGERDEDHLAAVIFNAALILDHEERIASGELPAELDDRDEWRKAKS